MNVRLGHRVGVTACLLLLVSHAPRSQQNLSRHYERLALEAAVPGQSESLRECATSFDLFRRTATGVSTLTPLADGRPLRADQFPRFLRPTDAGDFGFHNFLVLGDYETVTFERVDAIADDTHVDETWRRTGTDVVAGRLVSVFNPTWSIDLLHETLRYYTWGVDDPTLFWGQFVVPASAPVVFPGGDEGTTEAERVNVYLAVVPPNIPESELTRVNDQVQFTSHAVNIVQPDFGDSVVHGGATDFNEPVITRTFYEHFEDAYDVIAVVSQTTRIADFFGFHGVVSNDIGGIGLSIFDNTASYGSAGVLKAVEGYPPGGWATLSTVLHEQGHQYGEYTGTWDEVGPPVTTVQGAIDRKGHGPEAHTPLLFPGAVTYGAVLEGNVRVTEQEGAFRIERTTPLVTYNPLTLYRMGLIPPEVLPTYQVFLDQGQFNPESSTAPAHDTEVAGGRVEVSVNDMLAADGVRTGDVVTHIRRALVYVSRAGLAPPEEMNIVNYFAKRLGESSGVTSWDRYPSFAEATGGRAVMTTDITPTLDAVTPGAGGIPGAVKIEMSPDVRCATIGTDALVGVTLDHEVGGCLTGGAAMTLSGTLTLTDRSDYDTVCFRSRRYGAPTDDRLFECGRLSGGNRFSVTLNFPADRPGGWSLDPFAFFPDSGRQFPRMSYTGGIEVLP